MIDIKRLQEKAEKADSKSWKYAFRDGDMYLESELGSIMCDMQYYPWAPGENDFLFIAAASPDVILSLCSELTAARESKEAWLRVAMIAQEALSSIRSSQYCMPPSQYQMMYRAIREVQELWVPELERRRRANELLEAGKEGK